MATDHPFQLLFETLGRIPAAHAESVNRRAYEILSDILTVPVEKTGRCILLRAPRAGHGKTHLLSRIQHYLGSTHEFIPLHPAFGCRIDAASVTDDALRRLVRPLPASGGLCVLDLVTRRLFAIALQPLVASGEVPCQDREGALTALRNRPIETFDFHHPNAVTAHWARENFEVLGQRLSLELAQRCELPVREVAFWVETLFRFSATPVENSGRVRALAESVHAGNPADNEAMERLEALLGLLSLLMRVVLVADDLEGFSADETAALRLAAFLGSLRQSVERLDVILSLNQDIWQSAFLPRLSGGLADRLSEVVIELDPLTESEMISLLDSRVPGLGGRVLERIDVGSAGTHARGLIRAAGMAWLKATAMDSAPPAILAATPEVKRAEIRAVTEIPRAENATTVTEQVAALEPAAEPAPVPPVLEAAPVMEESNSWPAPEFSPSPPLAETAVDSPFLAAHRVDAPEPHEATMDPQDWQQAAPSYGSEHAPAAQFQPEPVASYQPQVDSPFQVGSPVSSPEPAPAFEFNPPPAESPFLAAPEVFIPEPHAATTPAQNWQDAPAAQFQPDPVTSYQPHLDSPFQAAPPVFSPEPAPAFEFNPPPAESPFQVAPEGFTPEPPAATFSTQPWQDIQPAAPAPTVVYQPQLDSPFHVAQPAFATEPSAVAAPAPQSQNYTPTAAPSGAEPAQVFQPGEPPVFAAHNPPAEPTPPPASPDTDRVDDLLRQFRERYGRGSL
ncbi:MAG: hypothetical protein ABI600_09805 [Luteolibacter sp.]